MRLKETVRPFEDMLVPPELKGAIGQMKPNWSQCEAALLLLKASLLTRKAAELPDQFERRVLVSGE